MEPKHCTARNLLEWKERKTNRKMSSIYTILCLCKYYFFGYVVRLHIFSNESFIMIRVYLQIIKIYMLFMIKAYIHSEKPMYSISFLKMYDITVTYVEGLFIVTQMIIQQVTVSACSH